MNVNIQTAAIMLLSLGVISPFVGWFRTSSLIMYCVIIEVSSPTAMALCKGSAGVWWPVDGAGGHDHTQS